jgi:hypothetical protein
VTAQGADCLGDRVANAVAEPPPVAEDASIELDKRIDAAVERVVSGHATMRIPVHRTDVDVVLRDCQARIRCLATELAAAQKERDEARSETAYLDNILEGIEHALGDRMKGEHSRAKARHIEALLADLAAAKADRDAFREELDAHIEARQNCKHILVGESAVQAVERLAKERDWERHEWPKQIAAALESQAKPEAAQEPVWSEPNDHTKNVCAIRRRSDGYWWQCDSEHGAGWNDKRIRQAWTAREARLEVERHLQGQDVEIVQLMPEPKPEAAAATDAEREGDAVLSRWLALDKSLTQLEWLVSMSVVVDELCCCALPFFVLVLIAACSSSPTRSPVAPMVNDVCPVIAMLYCEA